MAACSITRPRPARRRAVFAGFVVALCALGILLERRRRQSPEDYQRLRWVMWGCLIGLPTFTVAELAQTTTIFDTSFGDFTPPDDVIGLLYLVNGVLCLFVFEAIRRARVVSVSIPLRRVTILGLTLSIPALLLHHKVEYMQDASRHPQLGLDRDWRDLPLSSSPGFTRAPPMSPTATSTASSTASARISAPPSSTPRARPRSIASLPMSRFVPWRSPRRQRSAATAMRFIVTVKANGWDGAEARTLAAGDPHAHAAGQRVAVPHCRRG